MQLATTVTSTMYACCGLSSADWLLAENGVGYITVTHDLGADFALNILKFGFESLEIPLVAALESLANYS